MQPGEDGSPEREERDQHASERSFFNSEAVIGREVQTLVARMKTALPLISLIMAKFLIEHILKLIFYIGTAMVLFRTNNGLKEQVALKNLCNNKILLGLLGISASLLASIFFSMSIFGDEKLWLRLVLLGKNQPNMPLVDVLWFACVTDLAARTVLTMIKLLVCVWVPAIGLRSSSEYVFISSILNLGE